MKTKAWGWLVLLLIPGCLLVQPLDEAKPDAEGSAGGAGKASAQAGSGGKQAGGSGSGTAGSGNRGGSGPVSTGGSANGGAPSGVDFSLFTGTWTSTDGSSTISCDGGTPTTTPVDIGTSDTVELGTVSDLIFGPGNDCEILADVADRVASLNDATAECSFSDADYAYDQTVDSFQFAVSGNGRTAISHLTATVYVYDLVGNPVSVCDTDTTTEFSR